MEAQMKEFRESLRNVVQYLNTLVCTGWRLCV